MPILDILFHNFIIYLFGIFIKFLFLTYRAKFSPYFYVLYYIQTCFTLRVYAIFLVCKEEGKKKKSYITLLFLILDGHITTRKIPLILKKVYSLQFRIRMGNQAVVHTFNSRTREAESGRSLNWWPA